MNDREIREVIVDPHYERKHSTTINDQLILELIKTLNGRAFDPEGIDNDGFEYYSLDFMQYEGKFYRLVWLLPESGHYLGVVNAFRRSYGKAKR